MHRLEQHTCYKQTDMKKTAIIAVIVLTGCTQQEGNGSIKPANTIPIWNHSARIIVYDSCEYLIMDEGTNYGTMSHKGDCKNKIHLYSR